MAYGLLSSYFMSGLWLIVLSFYERLSSYGVLSSHVMNGRRRIGEIAYARLSRKSGDSANIWHLLCGKYMYAFLLYSNCRTSNRDSVIVLGPISTKGPFSDFPPCRAARGILHRKNSTADVQAGGILTQWVFYFGVSKLRRAIRGSKLH